jgi:mitogen-activated protein kinase 1/3
MDKPSSSTGDKKKQVIPMGKHSFECGGRIIAFQITYSLGTTFVVDDKYEYIKKIGHGAYGVVCSATNKKNGQKIAIKKVPPENFF